VRRATGTVAAPVMAALCTVALAGVLTGCRAHSAAAQPAGGMTGPAGSVTSQANSGTNPADSGAGVDSDLNSVDGQLSGLDSALAQATQSPSDGG